jgi:electron transfer flavoprotein beta subunit
MKPLNIAVIIKLEPDFSEGNVSYNPNGTLNRNETKNTLGPHSAIAAEAAFFSKVKYGANIFIGTMGPPFADFALQQAQEISDAKELHLYSDRAFAGADTLGTAEAIRAGLGKIDGKIDLVFSGHRASDGETGQTGPQVAWKLGFTFLGNVISYDVDVEKRTIRAKRLVSLQGVDDVIEEIEAPLPVFIAIDPSFKSNYNTVSERLAFQKYKKEAQMRAKDYKNYLKVFNGEQLGVDPTLIGLPGSPTIVHKVERVPKSTATRQVTVVDGANPEEIKKVVIKMREALLAMVIK